MVEVTVMVWVSGPSVTSMRTSPAAMSRMCRLCWMRSSRLSEVMVNSSATVASRLVVSKLVFWPTTVTSLPAGEGWLWLGAPALGVSSPPAAARNTIPVSGPTAYGRRSMVLPPSSAAGRSPVPASDRAVDGETSPPVSGAPGNPSMSSKPFLNTLVRPTAPGVADHAVHAPREHGAGYLGHRRHGVVQREVPGPGEH